MSPSICFVNDFFLKDDGVVTTGPMVQIYLIGKELARRGWRVDHLVTTKNEKGGLAEEHDGMRVHYVPHRRYGEVPGTWRLHKKLAEIDADVYYQRGRAPMTGIVAYHARTHSKTFVWSAAGESGMARGKYTKEQLRKKRLFRRALLWPYFWLQDRIYEWGIRRATVVLAQTDHQLERLREEFPRDGVVLRSGHPVPGEDVLSKPCPPVVMWMGSIKTVKQPYLFLELASRLRHEDAAFVMIGPMTDEGYREPIRFLAEGQESFTYVGAIPFGVTPEWFRKASLLVNTTRADYEGLPNVFVQAWLHGVPVVSLHSDPDDLLKRCSMGYQTGQFDHMVERVRALIRDNEGRRQMGETCRRVSVREFGLERIVDRLVQTVQQSSHAGIVSLGPFARKRLKTPIADQSERDSESSIPRSLMSGT